MNRLCKFNISSRFYESRKEYYLQVVFINFSHFWYCAQRKPLKWLRFLKTKMKISRVTYDSLYIFLLTKSIS
jgi:hypothetical protein